MILPSCLFFNSSWKPVHITQNLLSHSAQKKPQLFSVVLNLLSSPSRINFTTFHQRRKGNDVETASTHFPSAQFTFIQDHFFHLLSVTVEEIFLYPKLICFWSGACNSCFKMGKKLNMFMHQTENLIDGARMYKVAGKDEMQSGDRSPIQNFS